MSKPTDELNQDTTDFGFKQIPKEHKEERVANVFHSVADKYDLMNDLMSFGIHRLWKKWAIELCNIRHGQKILDLAGGTGDLCAQFSSLVGETGRVILADINESMLKVGRTRLRDQGLIHNIDYVQANAECLPFPTNYFDCITISFGLRNVTDKDSALGSMWRVLKPGGRLIVLEFSKPKHNMLNKMYDLYSFYLLPLMGKLVANDEESYRYLAESIRMHPDQDTLKQMMLDAGFDDVKYHNMSGGIVALHRGFKF